MSAVSMNIGAVYMTLNNPFCEVIDEEIRGLIDDGVSLIFINPVDWTKVQPALELARAAQIPVIAIDINVEDDSLVACTVVSDNYYAGVQCTEHLLKNSAGGKIAVLKHSQARSSIDRISGFRDKIAADNAK